MNVEISTSEPAKVDPAKVAKALEDAGYFVLTVSVNEGERQWENELLADDKGSASLTTVALCGAVRASYRRPGHVRRAAPRRYRRGDVVSFAETICPQCGGRRQHWTRYTLVGHRTLKNGQVRGGHYIERPDSAHYGADGRSFKSCGDPV